MSLEVFRRKLGNFLRIESLVCQDVGDINPIALATKLLSTPANQTTHQPLRLQLPPDNSEVCNHVHHHKPNAKKKRAIQTNMETQSNSVSDWINQLFQSIYFHPDDNVAIKAFEEHVDPSFLARYFIESSIAT